MSCSEFTGWNINQIMQNWGRSQTLDLWEQLDAGVRFLDLRIGINRQDGEWKVHHGMVYGDDLEFSFGMIQQFLEENETEVVIIGVSHVEHFRMSHLEDLFDMLDFYFSSFSQKPFRGWMDIPLEQLMNMGQRLFFIVSHLQLEELKDLGNLIWVNYQGKFLYNTFANRDKMEDMVDFNKKQIKMFKSYVKDGAEDVSEETGRCSKEVRHVGSKRKLKVKDKGTTVNKKFDLESAQTPNPAHRNRKKFKFKFRKVCKFATQKTIKKLYKERRLERAKKRVKGRNRWLGDKDQLYRGDNIYLMSWTLTPSIKTILKSFLPYMGNSLRTVSTGNYKRFLEFMDEIKEKDKYKSPILGNVLIFDFVTRDNATDVITALLDLKFDQN